VKGDLGELTGKLLHSILLTSFSLRLLGAGKEELVGEGGLPLKTLLEKRDFREIEAIIFLLTYYLSLV